MKIPFTAGYTIIKKGIKNALELLPHDEGKAPRVVVFKEGKFQHKSGGQFPTEYQMLFTPISREDNEYKFIGLKRINPYPKGRFGSKEEEREARKDATSIVLDVKDKSHKKKALKNKLYSEASKSGEISSLLASVSGIIREGVPEREVEIANEKFLDELVLPFDDIELKWEDIYKPVGALAGLKRKEGQFFLPQPEGTDANLFFQQYRNVPKLFKLMGQLVIGWGQWLFSFWNGASLGYIEEGDGFDYYKIKWALPIKFSKANIFDTKYFVEDIRRLDTLNVPKVREYMSTRGLGFPYFLHGEYRRAAEKGEIYRFPPHLQARLLFMERGQQFRDERIDTSRRGAYLPHAMEWDTNHYYLKDITDTWHFENYKEIFELKITDEEQDNLERVPEPLPEISKKSLDRINEFFDFEDSKDWGDKYNRDIELHQERIDKLKESSQNRLTLMLLLKRWKKKR